MQLSSELLPAPLGPMIAWTWPWVTVNDTSLSALTPPKRREMSSTSSSGSPSGRLLPFSECW